MKILIIAVIVIVLFCAIGYWTNRQLEVETITLKKKRLASLANDVSIVHVSDIHYGHLRVNREQLLKEISNKKPDVIFITGDTIDRTDDVVHSGVFDYVNRINEIAPTYVIEGNHERTCGTYEEWRELMRGTNATLLENEVRNITVKGQEIQLIALYNDAVTIPSVEKEKLVEEKPRLMLAHHPEKFEAYVENFSPLAPDIIFSGHAHGGQIRLPFIDGLLSPDQGLLPKYTNGQYESKICPTTTLIVSRGLSNSKFPFRINNKPHLIHIRFENEHQ